MVDLFDHAQKAVKKKAAAGTEQPAKETKSSKSKYGNSFVRDYATAKLKSKLSGIASILADYIYTHNGDDWRFLDWHAREVTGLSKDSIQKAKNELNDKKIIEILDLRDRHGHFAGQRTPFNYDFKTWATGAGKTGNGKTGNGKTGDGKTGAGKTGDINIHIDKQAHETESAGNINKREVEGAAAEPPHGPAFSESAPKKTGSTGKAQEQPRPFMAADYSEDEDPAPLPEKRGKPKKERKQFIPPTKEEIRLELKSLLEKKGTFQQWSDNDLRAMTDKFFDWYDASDWKKNNGEKLKDWQKSLNTTWLLKHNYLPERTTWNQPQREGKKIWTADQIMEFAGDADPQRALEQRREQEIQKGGVIIAE